MSNEAETSVLMTDFVNKTFMEMTNVNNFNMLFLRLKEAEVHYQWEKNV